MKYAAIIRAELDWLVILVDIDGNPHLHEIRYWGVGLDCKLTPLDSERQSLMRRNFLMLLDPNYPPKHWSSIEHLAKEKAAEPGWAESFAKPGT